MNKKLFIDIIKCYQEWHSNKEKLNFSLINYDALEEFTSPLENAIWRIFTEYFTSEGQDWLSWWIFENDFGQGGFKAFDENEVEISLNTIDQIWEFLQAYVA